MREDFMLLFDDDELKTASDWHGGQNSKLYAISSTGALALGTWRPKHEDGTSMNDKEWFEFIAGQLEAEALDTAKEAKKQAARAKGAEKAELKRDHDNLLRIADRAGCVARGSDPDYC